MARAELNRWVSLDYLRGLMALSILVFHYDKWTTGVWDATTLQGKLGVYAVSVFFVLSGMALTVTYQQTLTLDARALAAFGVRRVFRIFPLLWAATIATLLLDEQPRPLEVVFLNFSGFFGFVDPSKDIATGAWSIGCELVYYALFPLMLWLWRQQKWLLLWGAAVLALWAWNRAFQWPFLPAVEAQPVWWPFYVQAANHAFFFAAGMVLATWRKQLSAWPPWLWQVLLAIALSAFLWMPVGSNPVELVQGERRILFSCIAIVITGSWGFGIGHLRGVPQRFLGWLGAISYALYLLHPLAFRAVKAFLVRYPGFAEGWLLLLSFGASLLASHLVYYYFEKPAMRLGASLARKVSR